MSLAHVIARYGIATLPSSIPDAAREAGRVAAVDAISCMVAGARTDVYRAVLATLNDGSVSASDSGPGFPLANVVGTATRLRARDAALVNGASGHALDFDDVLWTQYGHPSVVLLPAALAVAQTCSRNGADALDAYVLGVEVVSRLGRFVNPTHYEHGWHTTSTIGVFGAALAAARLMGLTVAQTATAISIAASLAGGVRRNFGSMTKPFHAGNAARAGIHAAELAAAGLSADADALEGPAGWFRVFGARQIPDDAALQMSLAEGWDVVSPGIALKRYGACGCTHCALDAMVSLKDRYGFEATQIESIECVSHPLARKVLQHSRPVTGLEGKFSMEHSLAVAALVGMPTLAHFEDKWVTRDDVRELTERVRFTVDPQLAIEPSADAVPAVVTVRLRDGTVLSERVDVPLGDSRRPLSTEDRRRKFIACVPEETPQADVDACWERIERFGTETDWPRFWSLVGKVA